jgi:glycine cleavage system H protein
LSAHFEAINAPIFDQDKSMSKTPGHLKYAAESHEWVLRGDDDVVTVGITDFAQNSLGDVVYVELPEVGREVTQKEQIAVVESVKAASDIYAPLSGIVVAINATLADSPEAINESPYEQGWFFKIKITAASEIDNLLNADEYDAACDG